MKCALCNDTGRLWYATDQGVAPRCSCPALTTGESESNEVTLGQPQQRAEIPSSGDKPVAQAQ